MLSSITSIRTQVTKARAALLEPEVDLTGPILALESAAEQLRSFTANASGEGAQLKTELELLRLELGRVSTLARNGEAFWSGWGRLLGLEPEYTSAGVPATRDTAARIAVEG